MKKKLEVARTSLEVRKTEMQQQLEELKELKEANAKEEADKIREKDLEQGKTSEKTTRTWRKRGQKSL